MNSIDENIEALHCLLINSKMRSSPGNLSQESAWLEYGSCKHFANTKSILCLDFQTPLELIELFKRLWQEDDVNDDVIMQLVMAIFEQRENIADCNTEDIEIPSFIYTF